ncbi:choice-of-anchor D domain-containing protein [Rufibacter immobilis]|uniref:Choice-of-anchor D domain-containing protein n=1 Tax=Rufibacter immobilis TaxID=1348778 RepID=A0A3M9N3S5_9BACT|nr:S8 family serine peptidase [Rufibacter immobilis]RNI32035.1 choice-of-anchor D domain-containing protein [Rufibacter immobilis]
MKKLLLLLALMPFWWSAMGQTSVLPNYQSIPVPVSKSAKVSPFAPAFGSNTKQSILSIDGGQRVRTSGGQPAYWPDRIFVKLKNSSARLQTYSNNKSSANQRKAFQTAPDKVSAALRKFNPNRVEALKENAKLPSIRNTYEVEVSKTQELAQMLQELNQLPEVEYAERVPYYVLFDSPNDPRFTNNGQYYLNKIKAIDAFALHTGTQKTLVAIVDDGLLYTHPDLNANINLGKSFDVVDNDNDTRPPSAGENKAGPMVFSHGTHCAGVAGAVVNNSEGIAAVSNNKISIFGVKATSDYTQNTESISHGLQGMLYAIEQGARVISMSFGGAGTSQTYQKAINDATANGVVFVAAAGNDNVDEKHYPAAYENVIAVASSDQNDAKSTFSNYGTWVDISAPGTSILSTVVGADGSSGGYAAMSGTSMATPMVAGMVALMLSENPDLTPQAVLQIMRTTADPIGATTQYEGKLGAGRINVLEAIKSIQGQKNNAAPSAITNLQVSQVQTTSAVLSWTAPNVGGTAAATLYEVRYSTSPITADNFAAATKSKSSLVPGSPGASQTLTVTGLEPGRTLFFGVMARSFYGDGTLSNIVSAQTAAGARAQVSTTSLAFNLNRNVSTTATQQATLTNTGNVELQYRNTIVPTSGPSILFHGKPGPAIDNAVGLEGQSFVVAAKFVAGGQGFQVSHIQSILYSSETSNKTATIGVRILKGGSTPEGAAQIATQSFNLTIVPGISNYTFALTQAPQLQAGEVFWVALAMPSTVKVSQGLEDVGAMPNTYFISSDNGVTYADAQPLADFLKLAAFKMKAINGAWLSVAPATGNLASGQTQTLTVTADVSKVVNGEYTADLLINSNDALEPQISRPMRISVTGGQPVVAVNKTSLDFGNAFVGASRTQKIVIRNNGVADLVISSATVGGTSAKQTDFSFSPAMPLTIQPDKEQEVSITFKPSVKENLNGTLTLATNDPTTPSKVITLAAVLQSPPVVAVTPASVSKTITKSVASTATQSVKIQNTGDAALEYNVQVELEGINKISYETDAASLTAVGFQSVDVPTWVGMKFNVDQPSFRLSAVQNYYTTATAANRNILVRIYKGGTKPTEGALLHEQAFASSASAGSGGLITIPLEKHLNFVKNDVFWVVIRYTGVTHPQGTSRVTSAGRNYASTDGVSWSDYTTGTFRIRAVGAPLWLTATPVTGTLNKNTERDIQLSFNAADLNDGTYTGAVVVNTNDPASLKKSIPVTLTVEGSTPTPSFTAEATTVSVGQAVRFTNTSTSANAYEWTFEGGTPATSTATSPSVTYNTPGSYKVSLVAKNTTTGKTSAALVKEKYITVVSYACEVLNEPFQGTLTLYNFSEGQGYLVGNNILGDKAKANFFPYTGTGSTIVSTKIAFGYAAATSNTATVQVAVWNSNPTTGAPQNIIASKQVKITDIIADLNADRLTEVVFDAPAAITGNFYVGVVLNQTSGNVVALLSNRDGETTPTTAWNLSSQNVWKPFTEIWNARVGLYIQPTLLKSSTVPAKPTISRNGNVLSSNVAVGNQWYFNGTALAGATQKDYMATQNGIYTVKTSYGTCLTLSSDELNVTITGIADELEEVEGLVLYPNPTTGQFKVEFTADQRGDVLLALFDPIGKVISTEVLEGYRGNFSKTFNLQNRAAGIYLLKVRYGDKVTVRRVVLQ